MGKSFGTDWIVSSFLPKVVDVFNTERVPYNYRMTCLHALSAMMPLIREDLISEVIVPTLVKACSDKVANVQFTTSKIITEQRATLNNDMFDDVLVPKLREMSKDGDKDVAYYAKLALDE